MFENAVFPGIREVLDTLNTDGHRLHVVTAKPVAYARTILEHFQLAGSFESIHGPAREDRQFTKSRLLTQVLEQQCLSARDSLLVGDRADDIAAARSNGVIGIAVSWGYGSHDELVMSQPTHIVDAPQALPSIIQGFAERGRRR